MNFTQIINSNTIVLTEGSIIEQLRRDRSVVLDPHILHAEFPFDPDRRKRLEKLYRDYLDIGAAHDIRMMVGAPTWRANPERVSASTDRSCEEINKECVRLLTSLRSEYGEFSRKILVGGLLACKGDAYDPSESLSTDDAERFHRDQVEVLAESGVDYLLAATLPATDEACGIATAMSKSGIPYILSFVIRHTGKILDGTPLHKAISRIDSSVNPRPACYWVNCVHPTIFAGAMTTESFWSPTVTDRVIGLQANTSSLPPEELDDSTTLHTAEPSMFATWMLQLNRTFHTRILGGCCGTEPAHIRSIAEQIRGSDEH